METRHGCHCLVSEEGIPGSFQAREDTEAMHPANERTMMLMKIGQRLWKPGTAVAMEAGDVAFMKPVLLRSSLQAVEERG